MELIQVGSKTYYIKNKTNIGVYKTGRSSVCIIDTGSDGDGEKIDEILQAQGWGLDYIIITHAHIDHIGGNDYLVKKYDVPVYMTAANIAYAVFDDFETAILNGGKPCKQLKKVFTLPEPTNLRDIGTIQEDGITYEELPGHTLSMIGIRTDDDVWFFGDAYLSRHNLKKYRYGYIYDAGAFLDTLQKIKGFQGKVFIPSHGSVEDSVTEICDLNIENICEIFGIIKDICAEYTDFGHILQGLYRLMGMRPNVVQNAILSSTTKSYVAYLQDRGLLKYKFVDDIMMWKKAKKADE
ncbi:MAG: MBL fold metallo-hydrolase [Clostridiales bacterium]|nr:MBL fold metallo-hydrolase [Clostridiales bacterium]